MHIKLVLNFGSTQSLVNTTAQQLQCCTGAMAFGVTVLDGSRWGCWCLIHQTLSRALILQDRMEQNHDNAEPMNAEWLTTKAKSVTARLKCTTW